MDQRFKLLIGLFSLGKLSREEFIAQYFEDKVPDVTFFVKSLQDSIVERNGKAIEKDLALISILRFDESIFINALCELLYQDWHYCHESIAMSLKEIKSPLSVTDLYNVSEMQLEYLDYDDTYQFARKCIKALSAIADENAISKLELLAKSKIPKIAAYAQKELVYKGLL